MQGDAGDRLTPGDLREFGGSGNGSERKIRGADVGHALRLDGKRGAVGGDAQIRCGGIGRGRDELIWSVRIPHGDGTARRSAKCHENVIARSSTLNKRRSSETGDLRLRSRLNRWRARGEIHLGKTGGTSPSGATFPPEPEENPLSAGVTHPHMPTIA